MSYSNTSSLSVLPFDHLLAASGPSSKKPWALARVSDHPSFEFLTLCYVELPAFSCLIHRDARLAQLAVGLQSTPNNFSIALVLDSSSSSSHPNLNVARARARSFLHSLLAIFVAAPTLSRFPPLLAKKLPRGPTAL